MRNAEWGMRIEKGNENSPKAAIQNSCAGAFSAQRPDFRAASLLFRRKADRKNEMGKRRNLIDKKV